MLNTIQRYTLREIAGPALLGLGAFTFILFAGELYHLIDMLVNRSVTLPHIFSLLVCLLPIFLPLAIPMALLVGVLLGFGRLASENEVMALRTSGVNLWLICWPPIAVALALSVLLMGLNVSYFPSLNRKSKTLLIDIFFDSLSGLPPGQIHSPKQYGEFKFAFSFDRRNKKSPELLENFVLRVLLEEEKGKQEEWFIIAKSGLITKDMDRHEIRLILLDGQANICDPEDPLDMINMHFTQMTKMFRPKAKKKLRADPRDLSLATLIDKVRKLPPEKLPPEKLEEETKEERKQREKLVEQHGAYTVELYARFSNPLACLAFVLFGIPLAIKVRPRGKATSYGFTIAIIFFFYISLKYGESLGQSDSPLAGLVILAPNLLLMLVGAIMLRKTIWT